MNTLPIDYRVSAVFSLRPDDLQIQAEHVCRQAGLSYVVCLHARAERPPIPCVASWFLENMSANRSMDFLQAMHAITPKTLLVLYGIEVAHNYAQSMTRNLINHIASRTRFKIIAGRALVIDGLDDLYAQFAMLDKRILHANHYWCFAEDHREVSVFDGETVLSNKDIPYLAAKLRPFVHLDLEPATELQAELYRAIHAAPILARAHDITDLRLT